MCTKSCWNISSKVCFFPFKNMFAFTPKSTITCWILHVLNVREHVNFLEKFSGVNLLTIYTKPAKKRIKMFVISTLISYWNWSHAYVHEINGGHLKLKVRLAWGSQWIAKWSVPCFSTEEGPFWSVLQCFTVFIEKLGERIWQMPSFHYQPNGLFDIITSNAVYTNYIQKRLGESEITSHSQPRRLYKTALVWFRPFVESFLDFESGELCVCEVLKYFHNLAG